MSKCLLVCIAITFLLDFKVWFWLIIPRKNKWLYLFYILFYILYIIYILYIYFINIFIFILYLYIYLYWSIFKAISKLKKIKKSHPFYKKLMNSLIQQAIISIYCWLSIRLHSDGENEEKGSGRYQRNGKFSSYYWKSFKSERGD